MPMYVFHRTSRTDNLRSIKSRFNSTHHIILILPIYDEGGTSCLSFTSDIWVFLYVLNRCCICKRTRYIKNVGITEWFSGRGKGGGDWEVILMLLHWYHYLVVTRGACLNPLMAEERNRDRSIAPEQGSCRLLPNDYHTSHPPSPSFDIRNETGHMYAESEKRSTPWCTLAYLLSSTHRTNWRVVFIFLVEDGNE